MMPCTWRVQRAQPILALYKGTGARLALLSRHFFQGYGYADLNLILENTGPGGPK